MYAKVFTIGQEFLLKVMYYSNAYKVNFESIFKACDN